MSSTPSTSRFSLTGWLFFALIFLGIIGFIFIVSQRGGQGNRITF